MTMNSTKYLNSIKTAVPRGMKMVKEDRTRLAAGYTYIINLIEC